MVMLLYVQGNEVQRAFVPVCMLADSSNVGGYEYLAGLDSSPTFIR